MDVPFYAPTSWGPVAGVASLPDDGPLVGPAVVIYPEGGQTRIKRDAMRDGARRLAAAGQPVARLDYPGCGAGPGREAPRELLTSVMAEATAWFRDTVGLDELALGGTCYGALHAVAIAAQDPSVSAIVAHGLHLRPRMKKTVSLVRVGVAAIDALANHVPRAGVRGNKVFDEEAWRDALVSELEEVSSRARVVLIYNEGSAEIADFDALVADQRLSSEAAARIDIATMDGGAEVIDIERRVADLYATHLART